MEDLPHVIRTGSFTLFGAEVVTHVLSDGQRIVEADSLERLFKAMADDARPPLDHDEIVKYQAFMRGVE